jgi:hypothetical protein
MGLAEPFLELVPIQHLNLGQHSSDILPPRSCGTGKKVGSKQDFLIVSDTSDIQVVFNGAEPTVRIKRFNALGEHGRVGVLEGLESGPWRLFAIPAIVVIVVVVVACSKLL